MGFIYEERFSDSPYVETIMRGRTEGEGKTIRPAENCWHMVLVSYRGKRQFLLTGALTSSGIVPYNDGAEILWIKFKLGTYMPHLSPKDLLDSDTPLPGAASLSFWLKGSTWQLPDYENADTFVDRLAREEILVRDPVVSAVLHDEAQSMSPRTIRHHFLRATGLTHNHIFQFERAKKAVALLQQGVPVLDAVFEAGYYDQPHMTRALKHYIGHTPAQIQSTKAPA